MQYYDVIYHNILTLNGITTNFAILQYYLKYEWYCYKQRNIHNFIFAEM